MDLQDIKLVIAGTIVCILLAVTACGEQDMQAYVAEEDICISINDTELKLSSSWNEFVTIAKQQAWIVEESLRPDENGNGYGTVQTECGEILVRLMAGEMDGEVQIESMTFDFAAIDMEKVDLQGTELEGFVKKLSPVAEDLGIYEMDDYVYLQVEKEQGTSISIVRVPFEER